MKFSWKAFVKCKVNQFWLAKFISKLNQILVLGQPSPAAIFALIFIKLNGRKRQPLICTWVISVTFFYISLFAFSLFIKNRIPVTLSITFKQIKQQWPEKRKRDYSAKFVKTDLIENTLFFNTDLINSFINFRANEDYRYTQIFKLLGQPTRTGHTFSG